MHNNILTKKETDYLTKFNHKTSFFYGLPKIHKSKQITSAITKQKSEYIQLPRPTDLKFRPIVAGPVCPTHRLSNLIDIILQPYLKHVKSYVRDDIDFLNFIPKTVEDNVIMTSFDVTSLYSNIPHHLGKRAIKYWLDKFPETLNIRFTPDFILQSIDIILNNKTFQFDDKNYIQTLGTAMGTKMAPVYATLTLGFLEEQLYEEIENAHNLEFRTLFEQSWKRYLDDCFIFWKKSWGDINELHLLLQNLHPNIKFTMESNENEIPFLDILIKKSQNKIITDLYHKPTDTQQYLHFKSHHPKACRNNIPYNLARRIVTIVSDNTLKHQRLNELKTSLISRGYPKTLIDTGIAKALSLPNDSLRKPKNKMQEKEPLAFVTTFNHRNPELFTPAYRNLEQLKQSEKMKNVLQNTQVIKSKRQPKNLKQILTNAKFVNNLEKPNVYKCNGHLCGVCDIIIEGNSYTFPGNNTTFDIKRNLNCSAKNVIYVIECNKCKDWYIGSTENLKHRVALHKSNIKLSHNRVLNVSKHLHKCNQGFKIKPIYQCDDTSLLNLKEQLFINRYDPPLNRT